MKAVTFRKLLKKYESDLDYIVRLHCMDKIFLTNKQLDKVLKLRGEKTYPVMVNRYGGSK